MPAPECMVSGCGSSAYAVADLTADQEHQDRSRLPADVLLCNLHRDELAEPETEWMLARDRNGTKLDVGHSLRSLNEYIPVGIPNENLTGYGTGREFSHTDEDGHHLRLNARRRGDSEKEITLVIPSNEIARELKDWAKLLPSGDA